MRKQLAKCFVCALSILALGAGYSSLAIAEQPIELGLVSWERDVDAAISRVSKEGKPVALLFQEVPGCHGVQAFGREVLSNPEVVSRLEQQFIPVVVYNNKGGKDAQLLKRFNEPSWNYQILRFLDAEGKDLIARKSGVNTTAEVLARMDQALARFGATTSPEKKSVAASAAQLEEVYFAQYCFWTGERNLGAIEGVKATEAGFLKGREVTRVVYNPQEISLEALQQQARSGGVGDALYVSPSHSSTSGQVTVDGKAGEGEYRKAPASDQKRQLRGTPFMKLKMTPEQATKVNAFARTNVEKARSYLTPEQLEVLSK